MINYTAYKIWKFKLYKTQYYAIIFLIFIFFFLILFLHLHLLWMERIVAINDYRYTVLEKLKSWLGQEAKSFNHLFLDHALLLRIRPWWNKTIYHIHRPPRKMKTRLHVHESTTLIRKSTGKSSLEILMKKKSHGRTVFLTRTHNRSFSLKKSFQKAVRLPWAREHGYSTVDREIQHVEIYISILCKPTRADITPKLFLGEGEQNLDTRVACGPPKFHNT